MARETKRTSILLGTLGIVFLCIIIIICIVPKDGSDRAGQRARPVEDVITMTTTTSTTTGAPLPTTTSTTVAPLPTTTTTDATTTTTTTTDAPTTTTTDAPTTTTTDAPTTTTTSASHTTATTASPITTITNATTPFTTTTTTTTTTDGSTFTDTNTTIESTETTTATTSSPITTITDALPTSTTTPLTTTTDGSTFTDTNTTIESTETTSSHTTDVTTTASTSSSVTMNETDSTTDDVTSTSTEPPTTIPTTTTRELIYTKDSKVCQSSACKAVASDMLAMMDHSLTSNPCQDFYQYACGGVMQKSNIHPWKPDIIADNTIKDRLNMLNANDTMWPVRIFYDSCVKAGEQATNENLTQLVRDHFYPHEFNAPIFDLTTLLADMMKKDFTPFFNMELEASSDDGEAFALNLHPVVPGSPFSDDLARKVCLEQHHRNLTFLMDSGAYNVDEAYQDFMTCVGTGDGLQARLTRMEEAVVELGLDSTMPSPRYLDQIITKTEEFLIKLSDALPNIPDLVGNLTHMTYAKRYSSVLPGGVIEWERLMIELVPLYTSRDNIQVYMEDNILRMLNVLEEYMNNSPEDLNNILLILWSERIYTDFVKPVGASVGEHEYCRRTAIALMEDAASYLYLDALTQDEIEERNKEINTIVEGVLWAGIHNMTEQDYKAKLEDMMDNVIKANNTAKILETAEQSLKLVKLTNNFLENCFQLLNNSRTLMYDAYKTVTGETWRMFMRPYDSAGVYNYPMNRIMMPYAALEPYTYFKNIPDYLKYAGFGYKISQLLWHGYDSSGLAFQKGRHDVLPGATDFLSQWKNVYLSQYQRLQSHRNPSGLTANFRMGNLTENEVMADTKATPLAWQAYSLRNSPRPTDGTMSSGTYASVSARRRRRSNTLTEEKPLPWLGLTIQQLFYLHWAQCQCGDSNELSMLEVMESKQPPARVRVNLVTQNDKDFRNAFQCHVN